MGQLIRVSPRPPLPYGAGTPTYYYNGAMPICMIVSVCPFSLISISININPYSLNYNTSHIGSILYMNKF